MSHLLPTYSFLPWLRHGVANTITSADGDNSVILRASVEVKMKLSAEAVTGPALDKEIVKQVKLVGPGDIIGIASNAIVKVEPRNHNSNFEPNYLPYIEFYDEDFPWRYTPAAPGINHRLRPWIMLVVLKADEFKAGANIKGKPLDYITVTKEKTLPPPDQFWAWAHVHVNRPLSDKVTDDNTDAVTAKLESVLKENADLACARIVSPRKLEENVTYHAFLVPVFESGRLAGLGSAIPAALPATQSAWGVTEAAVDLPVYHRWEFRTGSLGDFEYLVRLLKPVTANPKVGRRDMDLQLPGANLPALTDPDGIPDDKKIEGVLKLGGALRAPLSQADFDLIKKYEQWSEVIAPSTHPFQKKMAALLNLEDDYKARASQLANQNSGLFAPPTDPDEPEDLDPVITPPIYGRWHAKVNRMLYDRDGNDLPNPKNWIHEMNLDPRFRVPNGFGTGVIQKNQEDYMNAAWKQIGDVLKGNQVIKQGHVSISASLRWYFNTLQPLQTKQPEKLILYTAPVHRRVVSQGLTIAHQIKNSTLPAAAVSAPMRRIIRPGSRLIKLTRFKADQPLGTLLTRLNAGEIFAAPPKVVSAGTPTIAGSTTPVDSSKLPQWIENLLKKIPKLKWLVLVIGILLALLIALLHPFAFICSAIILAITFWLYRRILVWEKMLLDKTVGHVEDVTPDIIANFPKRPDFRLSEPGDVFRPGIGTADNAEGTRFRESISDWAIQTAESKADGFVPPKVRLNFPTVQAELLDKLHPARTIPARILANVKIPAWIVAQLAEQFDTIWAYPKLDFPMYLPLSEISSELFLPNIHLIENNTISLLKTNQKFIESYMVGLNHEFARELLWREYPTDQRGSCFRQFWDVSSVIKPTKFDSEKKELEWRDKLYDIPEIHTWSLSGKLGNHDHREQPGQLQEDDVVLVVRGELFKKFPTAVIYAHKAEWELKPDGTVDPKKIRSLVKLTDADEDDLEDGQVASSNQKVKTPIYIAQVAPDIYFFGFDLTVEEVRGANGDEPDAKNHPGWFFVIKERPGEPRFGLDITKTDVKNSWNDLSWEDVTVTEGTLRVGGAAPAVTLTAPARNPGEDDDSLTQRTAQFNEDQQMTWSAQTNAAELAYVLYQVPALVAIHGAEMLPRDLAVGDI